MLEKKLYQILNYIESEINKPLDNYNYETRIWSKGYRKAMEKIKNFIWKCLNKDD
ncbi:MAG: hypothetical protein ACREVX_13770 [Clostridium sp.]|uniref:hypothetical protein n=1 Tax=Clostridium sp. TaxID=1506 RepID=UPI003D6D52F2